MHTGSFWFGGPTLVGEDPKVQTLPIKEGTPKVISLAGPNPVPWGCHLPRAAVGLQRSFPAGSSLFLRREAGTCRVQRSDPDLGSAARQRLTCLLKLRQRPHLCEVPQLVWLGPK